MASATGAHVAGTGTLVLPPQHASSGAPAVSITDSVVLRLVPRRKKKSVKWAEDVADIDEHAGKKKSKKCCIFHRRRQFGDWSDDDDSDAECDCENNGSQQQQPVKHALPAQQQQQLVEQRQQ